MLQDAPFSQNTYRHRRQTDDGRNTVAQAPPLLRSAKNCLKKQTGNGIWGIESSRDVRWRHVS